jgi:uncharacterized protein DUF2800
MTDDPRSGLPSASGFHMDVACAGRQNLIRELPASNGSVSAEEPSEYAARGTRIHKARTTGSTFELGDAKEVDAYWAGCRIEQRILNDWTGENQIARIPNALIPGRLWLRHPVTDVNVLSGELDVMYLAGQYALILDWKTGSAYYVSKAAASWQLRIYALLAWKTSPEIKNVRVAFVMPEAFGKKSDEADFTEYDLKQIERATYHALWKSQQPDAPRTAGPHCVFCPAKGICEEALRYAMLPAVVRPTPLEQSTNFIQTASTDALAEVWRRKNEVTKIFEDITKRLASLPPEELDRLGLRLTAGKKLDRITDNIGAFNALRSSGISSEQILNAMKFSKESLVKLIMDTMYCREAEATALYENGLDPFITRARGTPSLVEK